MVIYLNADLHFTAQCYSLYAGTVRSGKYGTAM
jgi:hypothetical protein